MRKLLLFTKNPSVYTGTQNDLIVNGAADKTIYFITGASGVGKTTLLNHLKNKYANKPWSFHHFDAIGVPSVMEMEKEFGSTVRWQEAKTHDWIYKLVNDYHDEKIFLEGQVNVDFIREAFEKNRFSNYQIILVDCNLEKMQYRLTHKRGQPELFTYEMVNWLKYLRNQANESGVPIIDGSELSLEEMVTEFEKIIG